MAASGLIVGVHALQILKIRFDNSNTSNLYQLHDPIENCLSEQEQSHDS